MKEILVGVWPFVSSLDDKRFVELIANLMKNYASFSYGIDSRLPWADFFLIVKDKKDTRSEERRVGKECRSRWSPYH